MQPSNGNGKFNPATNIPNEIALQFADGLPCQSPYNGDQVLFTLTDGRKWYVAPFIAEKVRSLGLAVGEPFNVTKNEVMRGNRRTIEWDIRRNAEAVSPAPAQVPASHTSNHLEKPAAQFNPTPAAPPAAPVVNGPTKAALVDSGRLVIDAVLQVEEYARNHGMTDFAFGADNIQKVWISVFIDVQRRWAR